MQPGQTWERGRRVQQLSWETRNPHRELN